MSSAPITRSRIAKQSEVTGGGVSDFGSVNLQTDINERFSVMKSDVAKKWLAKRQMERGGLSGGRYELQASSREGHSPGSVFKADGYVRTIYDMIDLHYNFMPRALGKTTGVSKADDPILTDTPGVHNEVYGADVFVLLNSEQNLFGILENRPWNKSGERIIDEFADTDRATGAEGENAEIPDTIKPNFDTFETSPRTVVHSFDVSQVQQLLAATDDDAIADDPFAMLRQWFGEGLPDQQSGGGEHPKKINEMLGLDALDAGGDSDYELNPYSIDQLIASGEEADEYETSDNEFDVYGFRRGGSSHEFECPNVLFDENNQVFHLDLLDDMVRLVKQNSDKNPQNNPEDYVFVTGHDTYQRIENEMGGKERIETVRTQTSVNGIQTVPGNDTGVAVAEYKGIPIVEAVDVPEDDLSRVYLIDKQSLWIKMLLPTQFYSTGTEVGDGPFPIGRLGNQGAYVTIMETVMKNPVTHAKLRDLE